MKKFLFSLLTIFGLFANDVDIICTSFNRPMQLYALLESIDKNVSGHNQIFAIVRSDAYYTEGYKIVEESFPEVKFFYQPKEKELVHKSFKPLMLKVLFDEEISTSKYCLFAMDDIIVLDTIDLDYGKTMLEKEPRYYGFYYRLGRNTKYTHVMKRYYTGLPNRMECIANDTYSWQFRRGKGDWGYPNSLDFTIFAKDNIRFCFKRMEYINPNTLEGHWSAYGPKHLKGLCHNRSRIVNIPMNRVNETWPNRFIGDYTTKELYVLFMQGKKIDISTIDPNKVISAHQNFAYRFVSRA